MSRQIRQYVEVASTIAFVTIVGWFVPLNYHAYGQIYLLAVIMLSVWVGPWPAFVAAIVSGIVWNYVFVPPRMSFAVLHTEDSLLLGTYFVVALIGSRVHSLRSSAERAKLLAESDRLHRTLLDSVSHELKTPIAVLRAAGEQLETRDPDKRLRLTREIRTAAHRLDTVVTNLLNQTRLESGAIRPRMELCDPRDLVASAQRVLGERLEGRPVNIDFPLHRPLFYADPVLMEQVIANLLLNAAMHTPKGGSIFVVTGTLQDPPRVFIQVIDEGPGIPPKLREKIFSKFQGGGGTGPGGLGLGLSIVRGFMLAQGGEATVGADPGGARFTITLPAAPADLLPHG